MTGVNTQPVQLPPEGPDQASNVYINLFAADSIHRVMQTQNILWGAVQKLL